LYNIIFNLFADKYNLKEDKFELKLFTEIVTI